MIAQNYPEAFATGFAEHLAEYALGRPIGFTDADLISDMTVRAKSKNDTIREFIDTLISSDTFREKK
ncbi:MAG: hypothetical protein ACI8XO_001798 [Verrucomicrobiales bacterium]